MMSSKVAIFAPIVRMPGPVLMSLPPEIAALSVSAASGLVTLIVPLVAEIEMTWLEVIVPPVYSSVPSSRKIWPAPNEPATPLFESSPPLIVPPPATLTSPVKS